GADAYGAEPGITPDIVEQIEGSMRDYLRTHAETLRGNGLVVDTATYTFADPASTVEDLARQVPGSLIVMTTHGRTGLARTLLGSVADRVIRSAISPVLLVPAQADGTTL